MSARTDLAAALTANLKVIRPRVYNVLAVADLPDVIRKATAIVHPPKYAPAPNAQGTWEASFRVTIVTHHDNITLAENVLDQAVPDVIQALVQYSGMTFDTAVPVIAKERWRGYDITCSTPIPKPF